MQGQGESEGGEEHQLEHHSQSASPCHKARLQRKLELDAGVLAEEDLAYVTVQVRILTDPSVLPCVPVSTLCPHVMCYVCLIVQGGVHGQRPCVYPVSLCSTLCPCVYPVSLCYVCLIMQGGVHGQLDYLG